MRDRMDIKLTRFDGPEATRREDVVAVEDTLSIRLDGVELVSLLYTPPLSAELALGYLLSEGYIKGMEDVAGVKAEEGSVDVRLVTPLSGEPSAKVRVLTSGCGGGITFTYPKGLKQLKPVRCDGTFASSYILDVCSEFRSGSELFDATGGVHSAALYLSGRRAAFAEDIGRHNAVDKVFGLCLSSGINPECGMLLSTGRISFEILIKCVKRGVPVVVSRGAPTSLAVELAERFGVTLVGFARGRRMNVYTHPERLGD